MKHLHPRARALAVALAVGVGIFGLAAPPASAGEDAPGDGPADPSTLVAQPTERDPVVDAPPAPEPTRREPAELDEQVRLKNRYIVVFKKGTPAGHIAQIRAEVVERGGRIHHDYDSSLRGFAATMSAGTVAGVRADERVRMVDADYEVDAASTQNSPSWGLDRVDQRPGPADGRYDYAADGAGVTAFMIDTGIRATHHDFGGRVAPGFSAVPGGTGDCNGHGTHTAATLGGATYGVAKAVTLVPVRVLDCQGGGSVSDLIAGIDWITGYVAEQQAATPGRAFLANMSLGVESRTSVDLAVESAITQGVTFVVAAGNEGGNACAQSPARAAAAITVAGTDTADKRASFSNAGSCVDIWAPGADIVSASYGSDSATKTMSGTSMATPHVAGAAALYLQRNPAATPAEVWAAIRDTATTGVLRGLGSGSPDRLLYAAALGGVPNRGGSLWAPEVQLTDARPGAGTVPLRVSLGSSIDPDGDGIRLHQLQASSDGGASWVDVALPTAKPTAVSLALPASGGLRLRSRAVDLLDAVGPWATGSGLNLALLDQKSSASFRTSSAWKTVPVRGAHGGSVKRAKKKGSSVTFTFTGRQVAWLATMAKDRGRAAVYIDGKKVDTVDLYRKSEAARRVVFCKTDLSAGKHKLTIVVLGKKSRKAKSSAVDVDGWTTLR